MYIVISFIVMYTSSATSNHMTFKSYIFGNIEVNNTHTEDLVGILPCARRCKNLGSCSGLIYNNTDRFCGLQFQNDSTDVVQELTGTGFQVVSHVQKSCGIWEKLLSVDKNGQIISGSFEKLKKTADIGAKLQIVVKRENKTLSYEINTVLSNDYLVCAQSKMHLTYSGKWSSPLFCTNGRIYMMTFNKNDIASESMYQLTDLISTDWFVLEDICHRVMLNENSKPYVTLDKSHLPSITVVQSNDIFVKANHQTFVDITKDQVEVTSCGEVASICKNDEFEFDKNFTWMSTKYNFSKYVEELRCSINENESCSFNESRVKQNMYVEGSWEKVFARTLSGDVDFGNFENLRIKLLEGHRVKVYFDDKYREPDIVFVDDNDISAVFSLYPITSLGSYHPSVFWSLLSTSGKYETIEIDYFTGKIMNHSMNTVAVIWFLDKAIWTNIHSTNSTSPERLIDATKAGSPIRIKSNCLHSNENSPMIDCLYAAKSIYYGEGNAVVSSRTNLIPYTTVNVTGLHLAMSDPPLWMHLTTHSNNILKIRSMQYGSTYFDNNIIRIEQTMSWYANLGLSY